MTDQTVETALDRYMALADRAVRDPAVLEELPTIFAANATVRLRDEPVIGIVSIAEFYRAFVAALTESKHYWTTVILGDGTIESHWVAAARRADGSLMTAAGIEHATVDSDGLISDLRNRYTRPPG
jgi:hypothetical protein